MAKIALPEGDIVSAAALSDFCTSLHIHSCMKVDGKEGLEVTNETLFGQKTGLERPRLPPRWPIERRDCPLRGLGLESHGTVVSYVPGQEVVGEGDPTENFFLVMGGLFRAEKFTADGRRQVFAFHMAGDLCGLEPDGTHKVTIEAQDHAAMAILPRGLCRLLTNDYPEIGAALFDGATRAFTLAIDHTMMIGCGSAEERLAWFLTTLAARSAGRSACLVDLLMQRQDIADYLGMTVETVSRTFTLFRHLGLIKLSHVHRVHILRPDALARLAAADRDAPPINTSRRGGFSASPNLQASGRRGVEGRVSSLTGEESDTSKTNFEGVTRPGQLAPVIPLPVIPFAGFPC
jgi:CRP/FNR family transcriptional regulator, nitrogen fixation regulation protein